MAVVVTAPIECRSDDVKVTSLITSIMRPRVLLFFFDMIVFGMGIAVVERLMFIFLLNDLKVYMLKVAYFCEALPYWRL